MDFCKEFCKKLWKENDNWNIRQLVDESFVGFLKPVHGCCCRQSETKPVTELLFSLKSVQLKCDTLNVSIRRILLQNYMTLA